MAPCRQCNQVTFLEVVGLPARVAMVENDIKPPLSQIAYQVPSVGPSVQCELLHSAVLQTALLIVCLTLRAHGCKLPSSEGKAPILSERYRSQLLLVHSLFRAATWAMTRTLNQFEASLHRHLYDLSAVATCPSCTPVVCGMLWPTPIPRSSLRRGRSCSYSTQQLQPMSHYMDIVSVAGVQPIHALSQFPSVRAEH